MPVIIAAISAAATTVAGALGISVSTLGTLAGIIGSVSLSFSSKPLRRS